VNTDFTRLLMEDQNALRCSSKKTHTTFKQFLGEMTLVPEKAKHICQGLKIPERQIKASGKDPGTVYELKRSRASVHPCPAVNSDTGHLQLPTP